MRIGGYDVDRELRKYEKATEGGEADMSTYECMEGCGTFDESEMIYLTDEPQCPMCGSADVAKQGD